MSVIFGLVVALIPNFFLLFPARRVCEKLSVSPRPWLLAVACCPWVALPAMALKLNPNPPVAKKLAVKLLLTALVIQTLFVVAGFYIAFA